jgi:hypothetical protein
MEVNCGSGGVDVSYSKRAGSVLLSVAEAPVHFAPSRANRANYGIRPIPREGRFGGIPRAPLLQEIGI